MNHKETWYVYWNNPAGHDRIRGAFVGVWSGELSGSDTRQQLAEWLDRGNYVAVRTDAAGTTGGEVPAIRFIKIDDPPKPDKVATIR